MNGGPKNGWTTWGSFEGSRLIRFIRHSKQLGMIPILVWYNIPEAEEGYAIGLRNVQDDDYMRAYFRNLRFALNLIQEEARDGPVGMILEPDFLGYLAQNGKRSSASPSLQRRALPTTLPC